MGPRQTADCIQFWQIVACDFQNSKKLRSLFLMTGGFAKAVRGDAWYLLVRARFWSRKVEKREKREKSKSQKVEKLLFFLLFAFFAAKSRNMRKVRKVKK